ncbi:EAL and HDOD domain-containing protein, partial [Sphaerochaeta sp. S2]|uniref:EAL and HDOD domain-containing protein n=1 Tax=Sphaerochaeta sp. S2 TaxID=2798868 RepID=UPI001E2DC2B6
IFDRDYKVVAYELLYREDHNNIFNGNISDNMATSLLLLNSFFNFGIDKLVGDSRAFINFDKHLINHGVAELLNKDKVTIEILESVEPDDRFLKELRKLKALGYVIAVDDVDQDYTHHAIIDLAELIKIDFKTSTEESIIKQSKEFKAKGKKLLAEKVESKEEYEKALELGFDYFQGFYFAKPKVQRNKKMDSSGLQYVRLMSELNNDEPDFNALSRIILLDVSLTYKILKLVNSYSKPVNEIKSVQQAIAVLGVKNFRRWLSLAMVQNLSTYETSEAVKYALIRSSLLHKIAENSTMAKHVEELSLIGTLSILDVIMEMDMKTVLESLPIGDELKDSLLGKETMYSDALKLCYAYEKGVFDEAEVAAVNIRYDLAKLPEHYVAAISWADQVYRELKNL